MTGVVQESYHQLNPKFNIPLEELEERVLYLFSLDYKDYKTVRPLKDIAHIHDISLMHEYELQAILRSIPLQSDHSFFPYRDAKINSLSISPDALALGQRYVQNSKILSLVSKAQSLFFPFITSGMSSLPPLNVYGESHDQELVLAFYMPPLVERHDGLSVLVDGLHRSIVARAAGTTVSSVHIDNINAPLHFTPSVSWDTLQYVDKKPALEDRFQDLRMDYFRDFSYVGIDG